MPGASPPAGVFRHPNSPTGCSGHLRQLRVSTAPAPPTISLWSSCWSPRKQLFVFEACEALCLLKGRGPFPIDSFHEFLLIWKAWKCYLWHVSDEKAFKQPQDSPNSIFFEISAWLFPRGMFLQVCVFYTGLLTTYIEFQARHKLLQESEWRN